MVPHDLKLQELLQHYIQMPYGARRLARICIQLLPESEGSIRLYVSPLYCRALFTFNGVGLSSPNGSSQGGKDNIMKLKIRYENEIQTIELDAKATEEMWVSLSLEGEGLSQKEREELIQKGSGNVKRFSWDGLRKQYWSALME